MENPGAGDSKHMEASIEKLEQRLNILENKLRTTFQEVERRFDILRKKGEEYDAEERITEMEDLLLLQQLEVTKLKDKAGLSVDIGLTPETPSLAERLNRLEHEISIAGGRGFVSGQEEGEESSAKEEAGQAALYSNEPPEEAPERAEEAREAPRAEAPLASFEPQSAEEPHSPVARPAPRKVREAQGRALARAEAAEAYAPAERMSPGRARKGILDDVNEILGMKAHA